MPKRLRVADDPPDSSAKRVKKDSDRLSNLSDELILRILHYLPVDSIVTCQRLSQRFDILAGDPQLWKTAYYDRFVRARASRLRANVPSKDAGFSSKLSRWLDEGDLVRKGHQTNWKRQYKIRHRWANGSCGVKEIPVPERPAMPPLLARLHKGIVYTVDTTVGLKAYAYKDDQKLLGQHVLRLPKHVEDTLKPSSIAVDAQDNTEGTHRVLVGFEDGSYGLYTFDTKENNFVLAYHHPPSSRGALTALAMTWPYVMTLTASQLLSLYRFSHIDSRDHLSDPVLMTSMQAGAIWPPLSIHMQHRSSSIVASIAYSLPTFSKGWSAGVQELHIDLDGELIHSRIASAIEQGFRPLSQYPDQDLSMPASTSDSTDVPYRNPLRTKPISLSYSHPYLLLSHADNTLALYMVNSTDAQLSLSAGKTLWGHTSGIFGAHVGGRGKAVSVSTHGEEVRLWQLEATAVRKGQTHSQVHDQSVQVTPELVKNNHLGIAPSQDQEQQLRTQPIISPPPWQPAVTRGWVGFDEEHVVVLREHFTNAGQALAIYDFT
ncbi:MAG: hypothetical protein M1828_002933 [Chrysothrix sp. TS-e1954]|nr:MAG: hypothetical protein M1828_002933 [Chrysothrix sp. TS-e1954]